MVHDVKTIENERKWQKTEKKSHPRILWCNMKETKIWHVTGEYEIVVDVDDSSGGDGAKQKV